MQAEEVVKIAGERVRPLEPHVVRPSLRPDNKERRPRTVLPAQHGGRIELLVVEPPRGERVRFVPIVIRRCVGVGQLAGVRVGAFTDERLRVELQGERGGDRVVHPSGEGNGFLLEVREPVGTRRVRS